MPQDLPSSGRSAVWIENNVLGIREVPVAAPGPGDVLVRVRAAGICGSDLHGFHGEETAAAHPRHRARP